MTKYSQMFVIFKQSLVFSHIVTIMCLSGILLQCKIILLDSWDLMPRACRLDNMMEGKVFQRIPLNTSTFFFQTYPCTGFLLEIILFFFFFCIPFFVSGSITVWHAKSSWGRLRVSVAISTTSVAMHVAFVAVIPFTPVCTYLSLVTFLVGVLLSVYMKYSWVLIDSCVARYIQLVHSAGALLLLAICPYSPTDFHASF